MSEIDASLEELNRSPSACAVFKRPTSRVGNLFVITAMLVHLKYGHSRADCAGGDGHRQGPRRLSLSVCDDRRAGRVRGFHDAYFFTGEHAGGGTRAI